MNPVATFQIGKNGVTSGVINSLNSLLEHFKHIRISVLKASRRNRNTMKDIANSIINQLKIPCKYTIIGFTIAIRRTLNTKDKI